MFSKTDNARSSDFYSCYSCSGVTVQPQRCRDCEQFFCPHCILDNGYCRQTAHKLNLIEQYLQGNEFLFVEHLTPAQQCYLAFRKIRIEKRARGWQLTQRRQKVKLDVVALRGTRRSSVAAPPNSRSPAASQ